MTMTMTMTMAPTTVPHTTAPPTIKPTSPKPSPKPTAKPSPQPTAKPTPKPAPAPTSSSPPLTGGTVTIGNFMYAMPERPVSPGARVAIYNADDVAHTLTITSAGIDVVVNGDSGAYFTAPSAPGDYHVTCDYHADMTATLVVK